MEKLPKHIMKALLDNRTSLGDHPAYPPEDEEKFVVRLLTKYYNSLLDDVGTDDVEKIRTQLSKLLVKCIKKERTCKEALQELCLDTVNSIFNIPQDTVEVSMELVNKIDASGHRAVPEATEDFSFENIKDMKRLTDEVYKRRMLNCLVAGAALHYTYDVSHYIQNVFKIDPELPLLYKQILALNSILLFLEKESNDQTTEGGIVDVNILSQGKMPTIEAKAIVFPILVEETLKGFFELAISHGLPKEKERAMYVMKKADFKLAEMWDLRLGVPLWERIISQVDDDVEPNFLLMELSKLNPDTFNELLQEVFAGTSIGKRKLNRIVKTINSKKNADDFDKYIQAMNGKYPIEDNFTSDELTIKDWERDL